MAVARPSGEGGFKFADFGINDVGTMIQFSGDSPVEVCTDVALLFGQIDEGNVNGI